MRIRLSAIALTLCLSPWALGQQDASSQRQERQTLPEGVTVIGERSRSELRVQMWEAEKNVYNIFNQFNDEKRFHVSCSMQQSTGTRIKRQVCNVGFELEATRDHAQSFLAYMNGMMGANSPPVEAVIASHLPEYRDKMRQIAQEHPEFREAIIQYGEIMQRYEAATSSRSSDD